MSKILSSTKNNTIVLRNRRRNKKYKLAIKSATKKYLFSIANYEQKKESLSFCLTNLSSVYKKIDKAVKKKVLHKNTAARKKSRLAKVMNNESYQ
uniref:Small ribosomal subunit protein bS20c n=1 Tax=Bostrychia simpliciuscula TaxID=324754 RepID=A0A1Z1M864_9FLOR|nr:ribosomal protein S20 [Bostrychia simpliciuscula]ARW62083.1 ribosomal protein S20 [Bostrychia simpliciuscula]